MLTYLKFKLTIQIRLSNKPFKPKKSLLSKPDFIKNIYNELSFPLRASEIKSMCLCNFINKHEIIFYGVPAVGGF